MEVHSAESSYASIFCFLFLSFVVFLIIVLSCSCSSFLLSSSSSSSTCPCTPFWHSETKLRFANFLFRLLLPLLLLLWISASSYVSTDSLFFLLTEKLTTALPHLPNQTKPNQTKPTHTHSHSHTHTYTHMKGNVRL